MIGECVIRGMTLAVDARRRPPWRPKGRAAGISPGRPTSAQALSSGERSMTRRRVVVVGGGFGGLQAVKPLARADADVTLIDRNNYHLFQPLSYQVATGSLSPAEIAVPLRQIFRRQTHVRVVMGEVTGIDLQRRQVLVDSPLTGGAPWTIPYDTLLLAAGSSYSYFGHDHWRSLALEVKSLDSSLRVRGRILQAFEAAELEPDPELQAAWLTFVVIGAGPTGVEVAGQIAELARDTLPAEFRASDPRAGRVLLVETTDRVLTAMSPSLSRHAERSLRQLGVTPLLSHTLVELRADGVELQTRNGATIRIPTRTVIWAAGVQASPLARMLGDAACAEIDRAGRVVVEPDLTLPNHPEVLAFGDMARVRDSQTGEPQALPGLAPVAMQQGRYAGRLVARRLAGQSTPPFRYHHEANWRQSVAHTRSPMPTAYASAAAWPGSSGCSSTSSYLVGFENRTLVLVRWTYSFITHGRGTRLITKAADTPPTQARPAHQDKARPVLQSAQ